MRVYRYLRNVSTLSYEPDKCTGCGRCAEVCPHRLFQMENGRARLLDRDRCMECGACARNCPFRAITVRSGVGCAWAVMVSRVKYRKQESCL